MFSMSQIFKQVQLKSLFAALGIAALLGLASPLSAQSTDQSTYLDTSYTEFLAETESEETACYSGGDKTAEGNSCYGIGTGHSSEHVTQVAKRAVEACYNNGCKNCRQAMCN